MPSTVADDNLPPVVMPACEERRILAGQKALVTGASSGIGRAIALALGDAGADVVVNYVSGEEEAQEVVERSRTCGSARHRPAGRRLARRIRCRQCSRTARGVRHDRHPRRERRPAEDAPFDQMTLAELEHRASDVNLTGQFLCAREAVREFKRRGVAQGVSCAAGKIICMSSVHEVIPWAGHVNYAASKGGVMLMMKSIAQEVAPYRIRVNSIGPGAIRTPINREAWDTPEAYAGS